MKYIIPPLGKKTLTLLATYARESAETFKVCPECKQVFVTGPQHRSDLCIVCKGDVKTVLNTYQTNWLREHKNRKMEVRV